MKSTFRWPDFLVVAIGMLCALAFAWTNPVFESPDEPEHLNYINFTAERWTLPNQLQEGQFVTQGHHHPLYYWVSAALVRVIDGDGKIDVRRSPNPASAASGGPDPEAPRFLPSDSPEDNRDIVAFRILRSLNACFAGLAVFFAIRLARRFVPDPYAWIGGLFVATLPQFAFVGGALSNDILAALLATVTLDALFGAAESKRWQSWAWIGLWFGLAVLAKKSCLVLVVPITVGIWFWGKPHLTVPRLPSRIGPMVVAFGTALAVCGWLFVRNRVLYGDILGTTMEERTVFFLVERKQISDPYFAGSFWRESILSFLARFGWMNVIVSLRLLGLLGLLWLTACCTSLKGFFTAKYRAQVAVLWSTVLATTAGVVFYNFTFTQPQGRLFFPMLGAMAALAAYGYSLWYEANKKWQKPMNTGLVVILIAIYLGCLFVNLRHYQQHHRKEKLVELHKRVGVNINRQRDASWDGIANTLEPTPVGVLGR